MRALLAFALLSVQWMVSAQSWCPPGATWTYEAGMFLAGFNRMSYTHDTVVAGYDAHVIDRYAAIQYPHPPPEPLFSGPPVITYTPSAVITRTADDVVYLLQGQAWDTLYWFGAVPGDHWFPAHISDTDCQPMMVTDTSTVVIDGMPLRRLVVGDNTVIERIGSTWDMFLFCPNWIIDGPMGMRCYSDDEISFQLVSGACEQFVGLNDAQSSTRSGIFPNPGSIHFTLDLPPGPHTITLFDATGRLVLQQSTTDARPVIATEALPAGLYRLTVRDAQGAVLGATWVKE